MGVFVSTNNGTSWLAVNTGLISNNILSLASDGTNVYAGTADYGIYMSTKYGSNWSAINNGLNSTWITSIQILNGYLFAGTNADGVFVSTNNGNNWSASSNGLPSQSNIRCMCVYGNNVFIGTGNGEIFASNNYGGNWISVTTGLVGSPVLSLCVSGANLYAGIDAGGVWKRPLSEITGINTFDSYLSFNIYPNPANEQLTIESTRLFESGIVSIFNINGQQLFTKKIDDCKIKINITNFACGVYFVKIFSNDCISIKKFIKE